MDVQRRLVFARPSGDSAHRFGIDRSDAVDRRADAYSIGFAQLVHAARPGVGVAVRKRKLLGLERSAVQAPAEVTGIDERDPNPFLASGVDERDPELVAMGVEV